MKEFKINVPMTKEEVKEIGKEVVKQGKDLLVEGFKVVKEEATYWSQSPTLSKVKKGLAGGLLKLSDYLSK